jgi:hypothetical protein
MAPLQPLVTPAGHAMADESGPSNSSTAMNTEAPRRAALVRNPARREWAPKSDALNPSFPV